MSHGCTGAIQLGAGQVRILQRHLAERHEPLVARQCLQREVVEDLGELHRLRRRTLVPEEHRRRRDHLQIDAVGIHIGTPYAAIPGLRADRAELGLADHDHRGPFGVDPQPRPAVAAARHREIRPAVRDQVGVDVDRHLPGCSVPQLGQVRASSLS
jgi:hypothetical protein